MANDLPPVPEPARFFQPASLRRTHADPARRVAMLCALLLLVADAAWPGDVWAGGRVAVHERHQKKRHQTGVASFYGPECKGRRTASGERFDPSQLTAAHRTLPFGTRVKVTNLDNGRHVVVRINDRGPYAHGRVLDLSRAAARKLGFTQEGVAHVRIEVLKDRGGERGRMAGAVGSPWRLPGAAAASPSAPTGRAARPAATRKRSTGRA